MIQPTERAIKRMDLQKIFRKEAHNVRQWPRLELNENASEKSVQAYNEWVALMQEDKNQEVHPFV